MKSFMVILVATLCAVPCVADAQLFWRAKANSSCPGGVCPTGNWTNRDGLSRSQHLEQVHGVSAAGMSLAEIQAHQNSYHNTYGAGHPVRGAMADVGRIAVSPFRMVAENRQVRREGRYQSVSGGTMSYGSCGGSSMSYGSAGGSSSQLQIGDSYAGGVVVAIGESGGDTVSATGIFNRRKASRQVITEQVNAALSEGLIDAQQAQAIKLAVKSPRMLRRMEEMIAERAQSSGAYSFALDADGEVIISAIDWTAIADFIKLIMPLILKLIELFSIFEQAGDVYGMQLVEASLDYLATLRWQSQLAC